jgi:hypothetical protein
MDAIETGDGGERRALESVWANRQQDLIVNDHITNAVIVRADVPRRRLGYELAVISKTAVKLAFSFALGQVRPEVTAILVSAAARQPDQAVERRP